LWSTWKRSSFLPFEDLLLEALVSSIIVARHRENTGKTRNSNKTWCSSFLSSFPLVRISRFRVSTTTQLVLRFKQRVRTTLWTWSGSRPPSFSVRVFTLLSQSTTVSEVVQYEGHVAAYDLGFGNNVLRFNRIQIKPRIKKEATLFCVIFYFFHDKYNPNKPFFFSFISLFSSGFTLLAQTRSHSGGQISMEVFFLILNI